MATIVIGVPKRIPLVCLEKQVLFPRLVKTVEVEAELARPWLNAMRARGEDLIFAALPVEKQPTNFTNLTGRVATLAR
jgi:ATP-dependent Lon protease